MVLKEGVLYQAIKNVGETSIIQIFNLRNLN